MVRARTRSQGRRRLRKGIRWGLGIFVILLVLEYLVLPQLGGAKKSVNLIGRVNIAYLLAGLALEAAALVAYAQLTRTLLPRNAPSRWRLLQVNMSSLALSHVIPGGTAAGAALNYRLLTQEGVRGADATFAIAMEGVGSAVVLNVIFWVALFVSLFFHGYNPLYAVAAGAGVVMMALFAGVIVLLTKGRRRAVDTVRNVARKVPYVDADGLARAVQRIADRLSMFAADRRLLYRAVRWASANWLLDAASLWVFVAAFGKLMSPIDLLVAYGLANVLAVIPITPGGLGVVEGVLIPTLVGFGAPKGVAVLGVLGYRLVNFWLPIPVGGACYLSLRFSHQTWRQRLSAAHEEIVEQKLPLGPASGDPGGNGVADDGERPVDSGERSVDGGERPIDGGEQPVEDSGAASRPGTPDPPGPGDSSAQATHSKAARRPSPLRRLWSNPNQQAI